MTLFDDGWNSSTENDAKRFHRCKKNLLNGRKGGAAHETENIVRLGVSNGRSTKRKRSKIRLQRVLRDPGRVEHRLFCCAGVPCSGTIFVHSSNEEISFLAVLYFPFVSEPLKGSRRNTVTLTGPTRGKQVFKFPKKRSVFLTR
jgi:hypothetical protein